MFLSGALDGFELKAYDLFSRRLNPAGPGEDVVIIKVDQRSIDALNSEAIRWPWPRQMYAPIIEFLSEADAVYIDILFTEPSSYGVEDDRLMAEALGAASNVFLPVFLTQGGKPLTTTDMDFLRRISLGGEAEAAVRFSSAITPIDELKEKARGGGNVTIAPDNDGVYRRVPLVFGMGDYRIPNFILSYFNEKGRLSACEGTVCIDGKGITLGNGNLLLRYYREPFSSLSSLDVIRAYVDEDNGIRRESFSGKKVFIGLTAAGLYDLKPTSVSSIATGVDIHATALQNLISDDFMRPLGDFWTALLILLACLIVSALVLRFYSLYINLSVFVMLIAGGIIFPAVLFMNGIYTNIVSPLAALMTAFILATAYSYAVEGRERRFTKRTFSQYMDNTLVEYLLKNPELIKPGGQRRRVTVFFADLAGFTTLAETISAEDAARMLHRVLNEFTEAIIARGGVVDKYMGDAVMAFWGAPVADEKDEANACLCALDCIEGLDKVNRTFKAEGLPGISARVGIHTGDAIAGNLGSDRLFDYTVVGDPVNLASRIEGANKVFGTSVIATENTIERTREAFLSRELGNVEVKGKTKPVKIFEVVSETSKTPGSIEESVLSFNQGLALYYERKWQEALKVFGGILDNSPDDGPSRFYWSRCMRLLEAPEEGWEVIRLAEK
jgi:adenylate cyclase